jgi:hypothetical protein
LGGIESTRLPSTKHFCAEADLVYFPKEISVFEVKLVGEDRMLSEES